MTAHQCTDVCPGSCSRTIQRSSSKCGCIAAASGPSSGWHFETREPRRNQRLLKYVADDLPFLKLILLSRADGGEFGMTDTAHDITREAAVRTQMIVSSPGRGPAQVAAVDHSQASRAAER